MELSQAEREALERVLSDIKHSPTPIDLPRIKRALVLLLEVTLGRAEAGRDGAPGRR